MLGEIQKKDNEYSKKLQDDSKAETKSADAAKIASLAQIKLDLAEATKDKNTAKTEYDKWNPISAKKDATGFSNALANTTKKVYLDAKNLESKLKQ